MGGGGTGARIQVDSGSGLLLSACEERLRRGKLSYRSNGTRALDSNPARRLLHRMSNNLVPARVRCSCATMVAESVQQACFGAREAVGVARDPRSDAGGRVRDSCVLDIRALNHYRSVLVGWYRGYSSRRDG